MLTNARSSLLSLYLEDTSVLTESENDYEMYD
jgi:hypothetical protein